MTRDDLDTGTRQYDLPPYRCDDCDRPIRLMSDRTGGMATVGVGCYCTLKNGRPFVALGSSPMNLPERWTIDD